MIKQQLNFMTPVVEDTVPSGSKFGDVVTGKKSECFHHGVDAAASYKRGDTVSVVFWSASPRNNVRSEGTFLEVQKKTDGVVLSCWR